MEGRLIGFHAEDAPLFLFRLEKRPVVLLEELQELVIVSPLDLVVVSDDVGLVRRSLRRSAGGNKGAKDREETKEEYS
jgi:hypothetical protein